MIDMNHRESAMPGHRRQRLPDDEIRDRMLAAAHEVLGVDGGLTVSLEHISFEDVIQRAAVSRSAAYRLWPYKDQFYEELLLDLAGPEWAGVAAFDEGTTALAHKIVDDHQDMLQSEEGRLALVVLAARLGSEQNFATVTSSSKWRTYIALTSTLVSMPEGPVRKALTVKMQEADETFLQRMGDFYEDISKRVGIRLRPEFDGDYRALAALGASVVEGLGIRRILDSPTVERTYKDTIFSSLDDAEWTLPSLGFASVLMAMVELDPDFVPPAASKRKAPKA